MSGEQSVKSLPDTLPIFPLTGVLLLPGGRLPLNIFEPRYVDMIRDAMSGSRLIGMIQPMESEAKKWKPVVYDVGCAGRITSFNETQDGRFLIVLTGVCRFRIGRELAVSTLYRQVAPDWHAYERDLKRGGEKADYDRERLLSGLRTYLEVQRIPADWASVEKAPDEALVNSLAMVCPFEPSEKQAMLEAPTLAERAQVITTLIEMSLLQRATSADPPPGGRLN